MSNSKELKKKYEKTLKKIRKNFGLRDTKSYEEYLKEEKKGRIIKNNKK